jgi:midasin (ATPase involved in ribosome maturation)
VNLVVETPMYVRTGLAGLPSHSRREIADEFNQRYALRWCDLLDGPGSKEFHADVDLAKEDNDQFHIMSDAYFNTIVLQRLETEEGHLAAVAAFKQVFKLLSLLNTRPSLRKSVSRDWVRVGQVVLQCKRAVKEVQTISPAVVLPSRIRHLEALALSVSSAWPAIVSSGGCLGSEAEDARNLVEALAALCGRRLTELRICLGTDSSDLLVCLRNATRLGKCDLLFRMGLKHWKEPADGIIAGHEPCL